MKEKQLQERIDQLEDVMVQIWDIIGHTPCIKHYGGPYVEENEQILDGAVNEINELVREVIQDKIQNDRLY